MQDDRLARPTLGKRLAHHRHERGDAGPGRDEQMGPAVVRLEQEPALGPDHPHPVPDRQPPQERREPDDRHESDVELVAAGHRVARRGRDGIGTLPELPIGEHAGRHVLAGFERDRLAVVLDPEVCEVVLLVDAADEGGVVLGCARVDDALVVDGEGHADLRQVGWVRSADGTRPIDGGAQFLPGTVATLTQPEWAGVRRYNRSVTTPTPSRPARPAAAPPGGPVPMTQTADRRRRPRPPGRQALHLRLGRRPRRGRRDDARPARRQGRGPRRDDQRGPAGPARLHDHDRGLQRLLHGRRAAPRRPLGGRPRRRSRRSRR